MGSGDAITGAEVDCLRAQLHRSDPASRMAALEILKSWSGRPLHDAAASKVIRAVTTTFPWVCDVGEDPEEHLVQLLLSEPTQVALPVVERAYSLCSERARRKLLRLIALRGDNEAVDALEGLMGSEGPWRLLPVPSDDLLLPIVAAPEAGRLAGTLATAALCRGWAQHSADILFELSADGKLSDTDRQLVADILEPHLNALVDSCNRATLVPNSDGDVSRVDRRNLAALLPTAVLFPAERGGRLLRRALSSSDPRVSATALCSILREDVPVPQERIDLVCRDPQARSILLRGLLCTGGPADLPAGHLSTRAVAEAELVAWLASERQLGVAPDEIEFRASLPAPRLWGRGEVQVFAFRLRSPHWSAERGWMIGAVGPFASAPEAGGEGSFEVLQDGCFAAHSLYAAEYEDCIEGHVLAISDALWGRQPDVA